ncbi:MAG: ROK family protein [Spirochaetia bacterium]
MKYAIGIDVGGTKINAGIVDRSGKVLRRFMTRAHSEKDPESVIETILDAYGSLRSEGGIAEEDLAGTCIGFAGTVNGHTGTVLVSSNLPAWDHFPLRDHIQRSIGGPVLFDNDTNLCALGEHRFGAGRGSSNMCYVTLSTGFGLGIILENRLYLGNTGTAGEIGHAVVVAGGCPCTCGKKGCLMAYTSAVGLSRMAYEAIDAGKETLLRRWLPADGSRFRGEDIAEAARQGDAVAVSILSTAGSYFGIGLSWIVQIINPELIVVGGGLTRAGPILMDAASAALKENVQPQLADSARLVSWQLGDDLGVIGAAAKVFAGS